MSPQTKAKVEKAHDLRKKAREALRKEGKPIPADLEKGKLSNVLKKVGYEDAAKGKTPEDSQEVAEMKEQVTKEKAELVEKEKEVSDKKAEVAKDKEQAAKMPSGPEKQAKEEAVKAKEEEVKGEEAVVKGKQEQVKAEEEEVKAKEAAVEQPDKEAPAGRQSQSPSPGGSFESPVATAAGLATKLAAARTLRSKVRTALTKAGYKIPSSLAKGSLKNAMVAAGIAPVAPAVAPQMGERLLGESVGNNVVRGKAITTKADPSTPNFVKKHSSAFITGGGKTTAKELAHQNQELHKDLNKLEKNTDFSVLDAKKVAATPNVHVPSDAADLKKKQQDKDAQQQSALASEKGAAQEQNKHNQAEVSRLKSQAKSDANAETANWEAKSAHLRQVQNGAQDIMKRQKLHAANTASLANNLNNNYNELLHEKQTMENYIVTDKIHVPSSRNGEIGKMKKDIEAANREIKSMNPGPEKVAQQQIMKKEEADLKKMEVTAQQEPGKDQTPASQQQPDATSNNEADKISGQQQPQPDANSHSKASQQQQQTPEVSKASQQQTPEVSQQQADAKKQPPNEQKTQSAAKDEPAESQTTLAKQQAVSKSEPKAAQQQPSEKSQQPDSRKTSEVSPSEARDDNRTLKQSQGNTSDAPGVQELKANNKAMKKELNDVEANDAKAMKAMANQVSETKVREAEEVAAAHNSALAAIKKVKEHVAKLEKRDQSTKEVAQKKEVSDVKHIAAKAALAVNAANVAAALHKKTTGKLNSSPDAQVNSGDPVKHRLKAKMAETKKTAEQAAHKWRMEAHKLADIESERAEKSKQKMDVAKEQAKEKMEHAEQVLHKEKGVYKKIAGKEESIEIQAKRNAKLSQMVTDTFQKHPVLDSEKKEAAEKAEEKAKHASAKAKGLLEKAKQEAMKANHEKDKAEQVSNGDLERAMKRKEDAEVELHHAKKEVAQVKQRRHTEGLSKPVDKPSAEKASQQTETEVKESDEAALFNAKSKSEAAAAENKLNRDTKQQNSKGPAK